MLYNELELVVIIDYNCYVALTNEMNNRNIKKKQHCGGHKVGPRGV